MKRTQPSVQTKLRIGPAADEYEREADRVADAVMRDDEEHEQDEEGVEDLIRPKAIPGRTPSVTPDLRSRIHAGRRDGEPLSGAVRTFFEPRFGVDFSAVRVHRSVAAAEIAQAINARAFTVGSDLFFGPGQFSPDTETGRRLVAHELAHTVQQNGGTEAIRRSPDRTTAVGRSASSESPTVAEATDGGAALLQCAGPELDAVTKARSDAISVIRDAVGKVGKPGTARGVRRILRQTFGPGADSQNRQRLIAGRLTQALRFLEGTKLNREIRCDPNMETVECGESAIWAFYAAGEITVCTSNLSEHIETATSSPARIAKRRTKQTGTTVTEQGDVEPTVGIESVEDAETRAQADIHKAQAVLVSVMVHEAMHHTIQPAIIDVYKQTRLFALMGSVTRRTEARALEPTALDNPDSYVLLALRLAQRRSGALPGAGAVLDDFAELKTEEKTELSIGPWVGARKIRFAFDLARESIREAARGIETVRGGQARSTPNESAGEDSVRSETTGSGGAPSPLHGGDVTLSAGTVMPLETRSRLGWRSYPQLSRDVIALLQSEAKIEKIGFPTPEVMEVLKKLQDELEKIRTDLGEKYVAIRRKHFAAEDEDTVQLTLPGGFEFRKMSEVEQAEYLIAEILRRGGKQNLTGYVVEFSRRYGVLRGFE